jgi:hypothetical protein
VKGIETKSYLFEMTDGLSANGVWVRAIGESDNAPVTVILNDKGKSAAGAEVSERVNRGERGLRRSKAKPKRDVQRSSRRQPARQRGRRRR